LGSTAWRRCQRSPKRFAAVTDKWYCVHSVVHRWWLMAGDRNMTRGTSKPSASVLPLQSGSTSLFSPYCQAAPLSSPLTVRQHLSLLPLESGSTYLFSPYSQAVPLCSPLTVRQHLSVLPLQSGITSLDWKSIL
jgi:hypothetical protein